MRHKEATQLHTHRRSHSGNSSAASRHTHPSISDAFIKLRLPLPLPHPQPQPRLVDDICGTMATLLQGAGTSCSDYCLPLEAATGGTGGQELVVELAGWDTRLGARRKFKLSAGSKRFALISTKMQRSPSLSPISLSRSCYLCLCPQSTYLLFLSCFFFAVSFVDIFSSKSNHSFCRIKMHKYFTCWDSPFSLLFLFFLLFFAFVLLPIDLGLNCLLIVAIVFRISLSRDAVACSKFKSPGANASSRVFKLTENQTFIILIL